MTNETSTDRACCEELREALRTALAKLEPPQGDSAVGPGQSGSSVDPHDQSPDASNALLAEIESIRQAMRDAGCDEE